MQTRNLLLFFAVTLLLFVGYFQLKQRLFPPPAEQPAAKDEEARKKERAKKEERAKKDKGKEEARGKEGRKPPEGEFRLPPEPEVTPAGELLHLGERDRNSKFHLGVALDPLGGGVRSVVLNKFQAADWRGLPVWADKQKKVPELLELVPDEANRRTPSFLLYHFNPKDPNDKDNDNQPRPRDTLGRRRWEVVGKRERQKDGRRHQVVSFRTELPEAGVVITKTYSLAEGDYHLGLEVRLERTKAGAPFRYQLTGAHGLPVEGKWYTSVFRNAMIAEVSAGGGSAVDRHLQELRQISLWEGGRQVEKQEGKLIRYAGVAVQYFASMVVVDENQDKQDFLRQARPTLETAVAKGAVKSVSRRWSKPWFVLTDEKNVESTFYAPPSVREQFDDLREGQRVAVIYHTGAYDDRIKECPRVVTELRRGDAADATHALWVDDITVRVAAEAELAAGKPVTHRYLLYHGPAKPSLLAQFSGDRAVAPGLVDRYADALHLNTLTDYHSPGGMGWFADQIYWTQLLIWFTNKMHLVLGWLHAVIPNYGVCIILLTVLVRGLMFPVSRKQALTSLRMQELAPELKKLGDKYKDDRQALGMAQMELYRKHGVNPLGTCWLLLLQMPIFMGLYYALQESIHFRLAEFWPTWIANLAAPDMLLYWGESIPLISQRADYGGFLYLGPYFNLLPVIAVALMIVQQRMMTPPPADEQQAMQQKMMTVMMVAFGLFFYKVAAGLCVYFIASSLWGFAERKLLPKKKKAGAAPAPEPAGTPAGGGPTGITNAVAPRKPGRKRKGERVREEEPTSALGRLRKRVRDWWENVLEQAQKK
jgi:YidC/Oxa1 family membrane protein insertase